MLLSLALTALRPGEAGEVGSAGVAVAGLKPGLRGIGGLAPTLRVLFFSAVFVVIGSVAQTATAEPAAPATPRDCAKALAAPPFSGLSGDELLAVREAKLGDHLIGRVCARDTLVT